MISSGALLALSMVVAPEAIAEGFFWYKLKDKCSFTTTLYSLLNIPRVLWSAPLIRVALEAITEFPVGSHDLRIVF
jgi:hypothetical protein